jgi:hypothetical protein
MKRWAQGAVACVLVLTLAACGNRQEQNTKSTVSSNQKVNKDRLKLNWDNGKTANLNDYMAEFGVVMKQSYTRIGKSTSEDWFGTSLSDYIDGKQKLVLDGQQRAVNWLPNPSRGSKSQLNVLAIYLDSKNNILYFFTNQNNTVRVYVSQERPDDNGLINIKETANTDLTAAFQAIAGGDEPKQPENAASSSASGTVTKADDTDNDDNAELTEFPANMQRTWYGYNDYTDGMQTLIISGNEMKSDGGTTIIHKSDERAADDYAGQAGMTEAHEDWAILRSFSNNGDWVNIFGWYQGAGAGMSYKVVLRNLNGSKVLVLTEAGGAQLDTYAHYYPTQELADKWQTTMFDDDNVEDGE